MTDSQADLPPEAQAAVNRLAYLAWKARGYSKFPSIRKMSEDWAAIADVADKGAMLGELLAEAVSRGLQVWDYYRLVVGSILAMIPDELGMRDKRLLAEAEEKLRALQHAVLTNNLPAAGDPTLRGYNSEPCSCYDLHGFSPDPTCVQHRGGSE